MTDAERAAYVAQDLRDRFSQSEFFKHLTGLNKKASQPLPIILTIVAGVVGIFETYTETPLMPPEPVPRGHQGYKVSDVAVGEFLQRDRDWIKNCKKVAKLLAIPSIRRRSRQINAAYKELFPEKTAGETLEEGEDDDDDDDDSLGAEPVVVGWGVTSLLRKLTELETQDLAARRRMGLDG